MSGRTSTPWAVNGERLKVAVERLFVAVRATRVLLFGSHARGDADSHSDVELMVVATVVPNRFEEMVRLRKSLDGMLLPVDLLVVSEEAFVERSQGPAPVEHDDAMRDHLVSDVPIGEFLSAGIDSTVLAAIAARHVGGLRMFTVGFDEPGAADELAGAKIAPESIGSKHEAIVLTRDRMAHLWRPARARVATSFLAVTAASVWRSGTLGSRKAFSGCRDFSEARRCGLRACVSRTMFTRRRSIFSVGRPARRK